MLNTFIIWSDFKYIDKNLMWLYLYFHKYIQKLNLDLILVIFLMWIMRLRLQHLDNFPCFYPLFKNINYLYTQFINKNNGQYLLVTRKPFEIINKTPHSITKYFDTINIYGIQDFNHVALKICTL